MRIILASSSPRRKKILSRLYKFYVKKHLFKLICALILSFGVAGGTASIAWLLDPAVKQIFIEQNRTMAILIPFAIVLAFATKGLSLYFARTTIIKVANEKKVALYFTNYRFFKH